MREPSGRFICEYCGEEILHPRQRSQKCHGRLDGLNCINLYHTRKRLIYQQFAKQGIPASEVTEEMIAQRFQEIREKKLRVKEMKERLAKGEFVSLTEIKSAKRDIKLVDKARRMINRRRGSKMQFEKPSVAGLTKLEGVAVDPGVPLEKQFKKLLKGPVKKRKKKTTEANVLKGKEDISTEKRGGFTLVEDCIEDSPVYDDTVEDIIKQGEELSAKEEIKTIDLPKALEKITIEGKIYDDTVKGKEIKTIDLNSERKPVEGVPSLAFLSLKKKGQEND
jgi:hypothetical protein